MNEKNDRQFSLTHLIYGVTLLALCLAVMTQQTNFLYGLFCTLTVFSFLTAALLAFFCLGEKRAFWIGFCWFGFGYAVLASQIEQFNGMNTLLTSQFVEVASNEFVRISFPSFDPESGVPLSPIDGWGTGTLSGGVHRYELFMAAGQYLWVWVLAYIGGVLGRVVYQRARE